jgi:3-hydroxyacyl-CoA dehydrogenase
MRSLVTYHRAGRIGRITFDSPPVNAISRPVVAALKTALASFEADAEAAALVIACEGRTFVAGGDIADFELPDFSAQPFNALLARIEASGRPVIAATHGTVLGGGLELAMACHHRVAHPSTRFGLPEIKLGLLPGSLGTQRLPRLVGAERAFEMILSGAPIDAERALQIGLIDAVSDAHPAEAGVAAAEALLAAGTPIRRTSSLAVAPAPEGFFEAARERADRAPAYPAPAAIVRSVRAAVELPFAQGEAVEAREFEALVASPVSKAMRHLFFAQREAAKIPGLARALTPRAILRVGIIGAGTMGGGIAMNFASAGIPTVLVETNQDALQRGVATIRKNYAASAAKGKLTAQQVEDRMALVSGSLDYAAIADCDLVIEAVYEDLELKKRVCATLGSAAKPGAILATNTSTLDVNVLARASGRPADFVGMHFFSPANVMRLLEVVRGEATSEEVLAAVLKLAQAIGKTPVVSGVCFGFIGNRMAEVYMREAEFLLLEGAEPQQVDAAAEALGMAMGPCRMLDMAGIDVGAKVVIERGKAGGLPPDPSYRAVVRRLHELGRHGQKTGAGYYRYEGRTPIADPAVTAIVQSLAQAHGIARRKAITDQEIVERLFFTMINEGLNILDEGIAFRPGDIDVVWVAGYGFPDHQGGPMFMADQIGLPVIAQRLAHYAAEHGNTFGYWSPSPLLTRLVEAGTRLEGWKQETRAG